MAAALCQAAAPVRPRKVGGGLNFFSENDEISMGRRYSEELNGKLDIVRDPLIVDYVTGLGRQLGRNSLRGGLDYRFFVVNTKEVNAFAVPGGFIYVNRGLIDTAASESELAGVLGHEIGHVVGRHATKQMSKQLLLAGLVAGASLAAGRKSEKWGGIVAALGGVGVFFAGLKYSRNDERQADWLGLENMARSGYDPGGMITFFQSSTERGARVPAWRSSVPIRCRPSGCATWRRRSSRWVRGPRA